jgi:subtilisin family serine protease
MTPEERFKIISNDYVDRFVQHNGREDILEMHRANSVHVMNDRYAVEYVPAAELTGIRIADIGYYTIPKCFGLESERSLEVSGVLRIRQSSTLGLRGKGVLVGIIDTGIDYRNPIFLQADGSSRIVELWDQTIDSEEGYPEGIYYGTVYTQEQINLALASDNPYELVPSRDEIGHGTMLAGIAAGSEAPQDNFSGVVPDSGLVIVKLKPAKPSVREIFAIPLDVPAFQENDIIWGVQYIIGVAQRMRMPVSICIGLGSSQGPHDGGGVLGSILSVAADFAGVTLSISAGNEGNLRRHFYGEIIREVGYTTVELNVAENEEGFTMELWGAAPSTYSIDITSPSGEYVPRIAEGLRVSREVTFIFDPTVIQVDYNMIESLVGDELILLRFRRPTAGVWTFQVYSRGDLPGSFHIWLPMGRFISQDTYFIQSNPYTTVTSPGNALVPITVTAYNPATSTLYQNASRGYTRLNEIKPELAAPGVNIQAPTIEMGFTELTGTSAAAAHMTGIAAMFLEWGIVRGNYPGLDTADVKKFLIRGARQSPRLQYPNRDWGYGAIDIFNVFNVLRTGG